MLCEKWLQSNIIKLFLAISTTYSLYYVKIVYCTHGCCVGVLVSLVSAVGFGTIDFRMYEDIEVIIPAIPASEMFFVRRVVKAIIPIETVFEWSWMNFLNFGNDIELWTR